MSYISIYILIIICFNSSSSQKLLLEQSSDQIYQVLQRKEIEKFQKAGLQKIENTKEKNTYSSIVNANQKFDIEIFYLFPSLIVPTLSVQDNNQINDQKGESFSEYQLQSKEISFELDLGGTNIKMSFSTYSNIFFVQSNLCTICCQDEYWYKIYKCSDHTCSNQVKRASSRYFINKFMDGYVSKDELLIGGIRMDSVEFLAIFDSQNINFLISEYQRGVIGFGAEKQGSLINQMYQQNLIPRNLFCLQTTHFLGQQPQITFGEFNSLYNEKLVHYFPIIEGAKQWKIKIEKVTIINQDILNDNDQSRDLIIAVNVNYILMPSIIFQKFLDILDKNMNLRYINQYFQVFECSELDYYTIFPTIELTLKDENNNLITYKLTPLDYVKNTFGYSKEFCTLKILPTNDSDWVIGDIFLKHTYSIFNYEKSAIGFIDLLQLRQEIDDEQQQGQGEEDLGEEQEEKQVTNNSQKSKQISKLIFYFLLILCLIAIGVYYYNQKYNIQFQNNEQDNGIQLLPLNNYQQ